MSTAAALPNPDLPSDSVELTEVRAQLCLDVHSNWASQAASICGEPRGHEGDHVGFGRSTWPGSSLPKTPVHQTEEPKL